jgi:hypothetical protein
MASRMTTGHVKGKVPLLAIYNPEKHIPCLDRATQAHLIQALAILSYNAFDLVEFASSKRGLEDRFELSNIPTGKLRSMPKSPNKHLRLPPEM